MQLEHEICLFSAKTLSRRRQIASKEREGEEDKEEVGRETGSKREREGVKGGERARERNIVRWESKGKSMERKRVEKTERKGTVSEILISGETKKERKKEGRGRKG